MGLRDGSRRGGRRPAERQGFKNACEQVSNLSVLLVRVSVKMRESTHPDHVGGSDKRSAERASMSRRLISSTKSSRRSHSLCASRSEVVGSEPRAMRSLMQKITTEFVLRANTNSSSRGGLTSARLCRSQPALSLAHPPHDPAGRMKLSVAALAALFAALPTALAGLEDARYSVRPPHFVIRLAGTCRSADGCFELDERSVQHVQRRAIRGRKLICSACVHRRFSLPRTSMGVSRSLVRFEAILQLTFHSFP